MASRKVPLPMGTCTGAWDGAWDGVSREHGSAILGAVYGVPMFVVLGDCSAQCGAGLLACILKSVILELLCSFRLS